MAMLAMLGGAVKGHGKDSTAASSWFAASLDAAGVPAQYPFRHLHPSM
jgi:hypothetical protein